MIKKNAEISNFDEAQLWMLLGKILQRELANESKVSLKISLEWRHVVVKLALSQKGREYSQSNNFLYKTPYNYIMQYPQTRVL